MYYSSSSFANLLFTALFLHQRCAVAQLVGALQHYGNETEGFLLATIENNSTANYSIEARNNLFDDANAYRPFIVKSLAGKIVPLVGTEVSYGALDDAAFLTMSPGTIWQRLFNMSEYIVPDSTASTPYSACFSVSFPNSNIFALNTTGFAAGENLATGFLGGNDVELFIDATPLHLNITVPAGQQSPIQTSTQPVGTQQPATVVAGTGVGVGAPAATIGNSIDDYLGGATGIFAKEQKPPQA